MFDYQVKKNYVEGRYQVVNRKRKEGRIYVGEVRSCLSKLSQLQNNKFQSGWMTPTQIISFI